MLGVSAQCCVVADDDIASQHQPTRASTGQHQPHMLPSPKRLQAEHPRAALEQPLLLISSAQPPPGHCTPSAFQFLSRIPDAALTTCPLRRRRRYLPLYARNLTAHLHSRSRHFHATKSLLSATQLLRATHILALRVALCGHL
jgi:hypothetical protein